VQNVGWRLDYVLVSERLADKLVDCIHRFHPNPYSLMVLSGHEPRLGIKTDEMLVNHILPSSNVTTVFLKPQISGLDPNPHLEQL
jgi:hypothetical protein